MTTPNDATESFGSLDRVIAEYVQAVEAGVVPNRQELLDRHPELHSVYFGNYRRLVYLAQAPKPGSLEQARAIAERMGLTFEYRETGYGTLATSLESAVKRGEEAASWRR